MMAYPEHCAKCGEQYTRKEIRKEYNVTDANGRCRDVIKVKCRRHGKFIFCKIHYSYRSDAQCPECRVEAAEQAARKHYASAPEYAYVNAYRKQGYDLETARSLSLGWYMQKQEEQEAAEKARIQEETDREFAERERKRAEDMASGALMECPKCRSPREARQGIILSHIIESRYHDEYERYTCKGTGMPGRHL